MKKLILAFALLTYYQLTQAQFLEVSENGRYLQHVDGDQFVWIGDTAWELFHKLNREEATEYLTKRADQGFTVIQAVVLAELNGLKVPNSYGEVPFENLNPTQPNEKYFEHVDYIVNKANELGLVIGMLPTWGDKVYSEHPGAGPIVFNKDNAGIYGEFLGNRYKDNRIVWILGGDRNVANEEVLEIWRSMAVGIDKGDNGVNLMTYHPRGNSSSSRYLHNEAWLDFNMYQSGHAQRFNNVYDYAQEDYMKYPVKPTLDGEPAYEDIAIKFWDYCDWSDPMRVPMSVLSEDYLISDESHFEDGFFNDYDVRVHAYWSFLSGSSGYTYGNNAVWQMFKKGGTIAIPCLTDWKAALDRDGANQMKYVRKLFEDRLKNGIVPDQSIIFGQNAKGKTHLLAGLSPEQNWLLVYASVGQPMQIIMSKIKADEVQASWFNPRNGEYIPIGEFENSGIQEFVPPSNGLNNDWVLILEEK